MSDNDSRHAAIKIYRKLRLGMIFNTSTFFGNLLIALFITYIFSRLEYNEAINYVFFISVLAVGLWITEAIPPFAVGIFIIGVLLLGFGTDYIIQTDSPTELYVGTWTSNVVWLLLGGFFLAEGMKQVELDRALFRFTISRFGSKPERLLLGLMLTTGAASMVMSNTATTAMMISSIVPLIHILGKESPFSKALLTGIPAAAAFGGLGTIIGSTPNAIAVGALYEKGISVSFIEWMAVGVPTGLLLILIFWQFLIYRLHLSHIQLDFSGITQRSANIDKLKRLAVIFILSITVFMWLTEPLHGIPIAAISAVPIVLLTMSHVISAEQVRALPWDTLMLVAGGLALGIALVEVGLADIVMAKVNSLSIPVFGIAILFSLIAVILSNFMSNTAAASILVPLGLTLPGLFGIAVPIIVAISCACSLLLPVSTPANAISYATGFLEQKEFRPGGIFLIFIGPAIAFIAVMIWVWALFDRF